MKKLLPAGKLKSLCYISEGAAILNADGKVGFVTSVSDKVTNAQDDTICEARISISYPCGGGASFHKYRRDGRSHHDAEHDIVRYCEDWESKVKSVKVWSNETLTKDMISAGNEVAQLFKSHLDTKKDSRTKSSKPSEYKGFMFFVNFTKSGMISVKVSTIRIDED